LQYCESGRNASHIEGAVIAACESASVVSDRSPDDDAVSHDALPWFVCVACTSGNIIKIANRQPFVKGFFMFFSIKYRANVTSTT
jgi:hypothetical protein